MLSSDPHPATTGGIRKLMSVVVRCSFNIGFMEKCGQKWTHESSSAKNRRNQKLVAAEVGESAKIKVASAAASRAQSLLYIVSAL